VVSEFGEAVRSAREARGWTQLDLAVRAGVSQRAISSWEKGVSEPGQATKMAVAAVLPLPPGVVPQGGETREGAGGALLAELPLEGLTAEEFEDFAVTLAGALYPDAEAHRQGKTGHKQDGFDVLVERDGQVLVAIQCKRVRQFGPREVGKAVTAATTEGIDTALIFLSRTASPDARAALRAHPGWQLWDRNKLSHKVHELPLDRAVSLVDRYFPLLREKFLNVPLPGPWLQPEQYFARSGRSERLGHRWPLVGREDTVGELARFTADPAGRVGILAGRGGTGKTKALHALCERVPTREISVRFLNRDVSIDHRAFEQLPAGRLLVIIDDAHDEDAPVSRVVAGVLAANPQAGIVLALRPDGERRARRQLREAGVDPQQAARWEVADLTQGEAEMLAGEVLGTEHAHAAPLLAAVARDCPFLLVTGAIMVREGTVDLRRLEGDDWLRRELVEFAIDAVAPGTGEPGMRQEVLQAVAALQPLRTRDSAFREALQQLTGHAFDQVLPHLSAWEDAGILMRRGQSYRIWPDLLGDALLARAAIARDTGAPTMYLDRVRQVAAGDALANLLVNASRVDWQEPPARRGQLVGSLWQEVAGAFRGADAAARTAMLGLLAKVAYYQPQPVLAIVRRVLEHPAEPARQDAGLGLSYTYTDRDVRDAATPALRTAAYDPEALSEAADLLWELARGDARHPNQHPNHALRILSELASFDHRGVTAFQQALPAIVERWLRRPQREGDAHDPLTVLHPLLAADGHQEIWDARALTLRPFLVNPDAPAVAELRSRVLDLAFRQVTSPDLSRAAAAAKTIGAALTGPSGGFGLEINEQHLMPWASHFDQALIRLLDTIRADPPGPVVSVALRDQLQWGAEHPVSMLYQRARQVLAALPSSPEHELARALHGGPADPPRDGAQPLDYLDWRDASQRFLSTSAAALANWPDHRLIMLTEQTLSDLRRGLGDDVGRARPFLYLLATDRPSLGESMCTQALRQPGGCLASLISAILSALAQAGSTRVIDLAQQLIITGDTGLAQQVAHAFGIQRARTSLLDGEADLLRALVRYPDPAGIVPAVTLGAIRHLAGPHRDLATELAISVLTGQSTGTALGELAMAFGPDGPLAWEDLPQHHKDAYLDALCAAASIEAYEISGFLAMLSLQDPRAVISLLTARVGAVEAGARPGSYTALPHSWPVPLRFRDCDDFPDLLREVREWIADAPGSVWRRHLGTELFATIAGPFDIQTRQIIDEYLSEPDETRIKTVSTILRGAPRALVWDAPFVSRCLRAADQCGTDSLTTMQNALHTTVLTGGRFTTPGHPYPQDIEQRDTAAQLAAQAVRGSVEEDFYRALSQSAETWIDRTISKDDLPTDGRDW
jgi:transcriptional regulator with XRE-family HTH domain